VLLYRAARPKAELDEPVVFEKSDPVPKAWFWAPVVLVESANHPKAELSLAVVLELSAEAPNAVLSTPVVLALSAEEPTPVLPVPVVVEFPANPKKALVLDTEPKANGVLPMLKLVLALTEPATEIVVPDWVTIELSTLAAPPVVVNTGMVAFLQAEPEEQVMVLAAGA